MHEASTLLSKDTHINIWNKKNTHNYLLTFTPKIRTIHEIPLKKVNTVHLNEFLLNVALFVCIFKKTHIYFLNTMKQIWWKMILWLRKIGLVLLMAFRTWASKSQKINQNHKKNSNIFEHSRKYLTRLWFPRCAGCEKTASHSPQSALQIELGTLIRSLLPKWFAKGKTISR